MMRGILTLKLHSANAEVCKNVFVLLTVKAD